MENEKCKNLKNQHLQMAKALQALTKVFIEMTLEKHPELVKAIGDYKLNVIITC